MKKNIYITIRAKSKEIVGPDALQRFLEKKYPDIEIKVLRVEEENI